MKASHFKTLMAFRTFTHTAPAVGHNGWFRTMIDTYKPGNRLTLVLSGSNHNLVVRIVKAFTPFTNSVALLVDAQTDKHETQLPSRFCLKLTDRRICDTWSFDLEKDYQTNIQSRVSQSGPSFEFDDSEDYLPWMDLYNTWKRWDASYHREHEAYRRLPEAQASGLIPRFFGTAKIEMMDRASHPSLSHINGLLIEHIHGRSMASLRPGISVTIEEAEVISQRILELGRRLRRYGVCHNDVYVANIILRAENDFPVLIDWGNASFDAVDLPLQERWNHMGLWQDFHSDIRSVLRSGIYYEGPNNDAVCPSIPAGGVWHRHRTPVSNEEQIHAAQELGFNAVNRLIQNLSSREELEMFYDEETGVDVKHGLRWRVKKGIKTRGFDDPCPVV
ncbi:hypothetical protein E4T56_gene6712 [Termitomyces sp. T112]|nr:hypothetical protein E4T56_gene6712 [Termitomyces sp. T112]KNZ72396.1 hypothetical protein J132_03488 [Termitomyces sp. J132]